ncbi:MAG TPA: hypothetical protein VFF73_42040 [Planctomycetota bacterium]|nr:hypothetical protein [Planctomycetota bacterium]
MTTAFSSESASPSEGKKIPRSVALTGAIVLAALYVRIWFGVDLTDESFYAALPLELALGLRPFVDERSVSQGFLTVLPVKLFVAARGSTDGLVLLLRHVHVAALLATGVAVFSFLSARTSRAVALGGALVVATFVPFSIPAPSYNTVASLALCAGALLAADASRVARPGALLVAAVLAHAVAALAYPPLILACVASLVLGARAVARERPRPLAWRTLALAGAVALALVVATAALLLATGRADLARCLEHAAALGSGAALRDAPTLGGAVLLLVRRLRPAMMLASALLVAASIGSPRVMGRLWPLAGVPVALGAATCVVCWKNQPLGHGVPTLLGLGAVPWAVGVRRLPLPRDLRDPWLVSLVGSFTTTASSTNGFLNTCVGLLPAFVVGIAALAPRSSRHAEGAAASLVLMAAAQVGFFYGYVYLDEPIFALSARVGGGPWHGIWTTPDRAELVEMLRADMEDQVRAGARTIFAYDDMPWALLVTPKLRPAGPTAWIHPSQPRARSLEALDLAGRPMPDVVVRSRATSRGPDDPLDALVESAGFRVILRRPEYDILRK